jgi:hypothetical protein
VKAGRYLLLIPISWPLLILSQRKPWRRCRWRHGRLGPSWWNEMTIDFWDGR